MMRGGSGSQQFFVRRLTGIYELKGITLKTLWRENDRPGLPTDFDSQKGILMIFEKK